MNPASMNIVIAINKHYLTYAYVMLTSFLENNRLSATVYVLHHELTTEDEAVLSQLSNSYTVAFHFLYVPDTLLPSAEVLAANSWGIETYFRLTILDLVPANVSRILYLDSDMIVNHNLEELYFCNLNGNMLAACYDFYSVPPFNDYRDTLFSPIINEQFRYFNAGLLLLDLDSLRSSGYCFKHYMSTAASLNYKIQFPDQDLLNYCHHSETLFLDFKRYNLYARRAFTDYNFHYEDVKCHTSIVHYANDKPWQGNCLHCDIELLWWDYAKKTPFYHQLLNNMLQAVIMNRDIAVYITNLKEEHQQLSELVSQYESILKKAGIPF